MEVEYLKSKKDLDDSNDNNFVLDFTASWCGPCQVIAPQFESISKEEIFKHIKFYKVDVDENEDLCEEYEINCIPTFVFLKDKKLVDSMKGANIKDLRSKIESNFCETNDDKEIDIDTSTSQTNAEIASSEGM